MMKTKKERTSSKNCFNKELFKQMVNNGEIRGMKDMFGNIFKELLEAEMDDETEKLGFHLSPISGIL